MDRRKFLKFMGVTAAVTSVSGGLTSKFAKRLAPGATKLFERTEANKDKLPDYYYNPVRGAHFCMAIDVGACIGCRQCEYACKEENNLADNLDMNWIRLFEREDEESINEVHSVPPEDSRTDYTKSPKKGHWYLPSNCYHCDNPPCVKVCPVGATWKSADGIVMIDYFRCIGCRYCMVACPYNARRFNWFEPEFDSGREINPEVPVRPPGVVEKCTFCVHRTRKGLSPRCVEACPVNARHFGDINDPDSEISQIIDTFETTRLLEDMNTNPRLIYFDSGEKWTKNGEVL